MHRNRRFPAARRRMGRRRHPGGPFRRPHHRLLVERRLRRMEERLERLLESGDTD